MPYSLTPLLFFLPVTESGGQQDLAKRTLEDILRQGILGSEVGGGNWGEIPSPDPVSPQNQTAHGNLTYTLVLL